MGRKQDRIGLAVAVALHLAVLGAIMFRPPHHAVVKPPQRIEVTISDQYGKTSMSPDPDSQAASDRGPVLGEPAPVPEVAPEPSPELPAPTPRQTQAPVSAPKAKPQPKPVPKPAPKATQKPKPAPKAPSKTTPPRKASAIDDIIAKPSRKSAASSAAKSSSTPKKSGASAFDAAFKDGTPGATSDSGKGAPAAKAGPQVVSALSAAITRQLKPHWNPPDGVDVDKLVTILSFDLNPDGSLAGKPRVVRQMGIDAANSAQAGRHAEQAIRAVQLASPFNLPSDYYDAWKHVSSFRFDVRLSQ